MTRRRPSASRRTALVLVLLAAWGPALAAQAPEEEGSRWTTYLGAAGLGILGFVAGGYAAGAASAADDGCEDLGCLEAAFYGAAALGTIGVGVGAHLGNGRRGDVALDLATAAGVWALGIGPVILSGDGDGPYAIAAFILVPIAQVLVTTEVERARGRAKVRARRVSIGLRPVRFRDGTGLVVDLRF